MCESGSASRFVGEASGGDAGLDYTVHGEWVAGYPAFMWPGLQELDQVADDGETDRGATGQEHGAAHA